MEFLYDPRFIVFALGCLGAAVAAWFKTQSRIERVEQAAKTDRDDAQAFQEEVRGALKKNDSDQSTRDLDMKGIKKDLEFQGKRLDEWVDQLKKVVGDLQGVAIKLAQGDHGKA